jgi:single-stranded DNA-binding protein
LSEIRNNEVSLIGRLVGDPVRAASGRVYFRLEASRTQAPFRCFCTGKTAKNMMENLRDGDEVSIFGKLSWVKFRRETPQLMVFARHTSYGRKARTLR